MKINGWTIYAHPLFLNAYEELLNEVERLKQKYPEEYKKKRFSKLLAAVTKLAFTDIPSCPDDQRYRQGKTLGNKYKHWYRANFFQQYRLFFRYSKNDQIIILVWINDQDTKRCRGNKSDTYNIFRGMLNNDNPPNNWVELLKEAKKETERLEKIRKSLEK